MSTLQVATGHLHSVQRRLGRNSSFKHLARAIKITRNGLNVMGRPVARDNLRVIPQQAKDAPTKGRH